MSVRVEAQGNGYLVLNQNYYPGWRVKGAKSKQIRAMKGLIAIEVSPLDKNIEFYYLPWSFVFGLILTTTTALFSLFMLKGRVMKTMPLGVDER